MWEWEWVHLGAGAHVVRRDNIAQHPESRIVFCQLLKASIDAYTGLVVMMPSSSAALLCLYIVARLFPVLIYLRELGR